MGMVYIKRRTIMITILILIVLIALLSIFKYNSKAATVMNILVSDKVIGIDPGHGGIDGGAVGVSGVEEAEINLQIALKLKALFEQNGGIVIMTRENDEGLYTEKSNTVKEMKTEDLYKRKEIIENNGCDVFISIHLNSFEQSQYYGAQTFYGEDDEESKKLAYIIQEQLKNELDKDNHRVPQLTGEVFLINELNMPSVLVECGFLSNPQEEKQLISEKYQNKISISIYNGILRFLTNNT